MIAARTAITLASLVALGLAGAAACGSSESSSGESRAASEEVKSATPAGAARDAAVANPFCNARAFDGGCAYIH